ncbi:hypothetical protein ACFFSY_01600 [Paenibacillus aurantiacus]|uniref:Uncharacterized protein n=1 Tax=Paenibacillus aurantiacus TaxID=1936118 RepID=A0ABV5KHB9_9BACL
MGIAIAIFLNLVAGPVGGIIALGLAFGLIFSIYQKSKMIYDDLQLIKRKLNIDDRDEAFEKYQVEEADDDHNQNSHTGLTEINEEIERELEEYAKRGKTKADNPNSD